MSFVFGQFSFGDQPADQKRFDARVEKAGNMPFGVRVASATDRICLAVSSRVSIGRCGAVSAWLDGELHDRSALAERLDRDAVAGDAAMVAMAWRRWREDAFRHLQGDFAGVIADDETVVLFRDHIGTRPLYWHWEGGRLTVASFVPDLLGLLPTAPEPHEEAIAAFLSRPSALTPYTLLKGVHSVRPGFGVVIEASGPRVLRWWRPEAVADVRFKRPEDYAAAFRELTDRAIEDRVPPDRTIGAHLSGGIDSTAVALLAQQRLVHAGRGLVGVYSWSPPISEAAPEMGEIDERLRIVEICEAAGLSPRFGVLTGAAERAFLERPLELEGPADLLEELDILDRARGDGVQVILSGWGGDEAYSAHANSVPAWLLAKGRLRRLFAILRRWHGLRRPHRMASALWSNSIVPRLPDPLFARFGPYTDLNTNRFASPALKALAPLELRPQGARLTADPVADLIAHIDQRHIGERMATWAAWGAPHGIEYRYPLTDRRIMEFVLGVPPDILWGDGRSRYLARASLQGRIQGRLSKSDPANERKRLAAAREAWRILGAEAQRGLFDKPCPWLDMPSLRGEISPGPSGDDKADIRTFPAIFHAMRIWHMFERFDALGASRASRGAS